MEHDLYITRRKINHFDPYNVLLAIATNIPMLLMTAFVLQGHILWRYLHFWVTLYVSQTVVLNAVIRL